MSETQSLYYSRGVTPNQVYTDSSLLSELNANVQGISLPIAISDEDVQVGENYYYALKAYPTTDLTGEGYTVKDSNSGLPLYVGYFTEGNDKIVTIDENGTLTELDTELINTQTGTVSIAPTPSSATVVINGEIRSDITAAVGTTVSYTVFKDGYVTVEDTVTIASGTNLIPVELEEASSGGGVALMVNYHPSSATVAINGTAGNIAVVPTNSPTTITASATGYDAFTPIVETYTANTVKNIYLYKHVAYEASGGNPPTLSPDGESAISDYFDGLNWKFEASMPIPSTPVVVSESDIRMYMGSMMGSNQDMLGFTIDSHGVTLYGLGNISYTDLELDRDPSDTSNYAELPTKLEITPISLGKASDMVWANVHVKITITNLINNSTRIVESDVIYDEYSCVVRKDISDLYMVYSGWSLSNTLLHAEYNIYNSNTRENINSGNANLYYSEE